MTGSIWSYIEITGWQDWQLSLPSILEAITFSCFLGKLPQLPIKLPLFLVGDKKFVWTGYEDKHRQFVSYELSSTPLARRHHYFTSIRIDDSGSWLWQAWQGSSSLRGHVIRHCTRCSSCLSCQRYCASSTDIDSTRLPAACYGRAL